MREAIDYRTYRLDGKEKKVLIGGLAGCSILLSFLFFDSLIPAVFGLLLYPAVTKEAEKVLGERRRKALRNQFRDFLFSVSASFASGRHLTESMMEALTELNRMYPPDSPIVQETSYMVGLLRGGAAGETEVLSDFSRRAALDEVDEIVRVICACRETGGDMPSAMNRAAALISEEMQIEDEIRMQVVQRKLEGRIITVMPVGIILFLRLVSPDYIGILYQTVAGRLIKAAALAATAATYRMTERITNVEI